MKTVRMMVGSVAVAFAAFAGAFESLAAETTLPTPIYWYEFNGNMLSSLSGGSQFVRWDDSAKKEIKTGGTYCKVRASTSNNAATQFEPYGQLFEITNHYGTGWTMAFDAQLSATSNALLFALGTHNNDCYDGLAIHSEGANRLAISHWVKNTARVVWATVDVLDLNTKMHSIVLTCSGLKAGTQWSRDLALYVDGAKKIELTKDYTPQKQFQLFSMQSGIFSTGYVSGKDGIVDSFRVFGEVLSADQIALLADQSPVWPQEDEIGCIPEHRFTFDGAIRQIGLSGMVVNGGTDAAKFISVRDDGRQGMESGTPYGNGINYDGDYTVFCSGKMDIVNNCVLFHMGWNTPSNVAGSNNVALVRGTDATTVRVVGFGGTTAATNLIAATVDGVSSHLHSYALVYASEAKTLTLYVDGSNKGTASGVERPTDTGWMFLDVCGGLGKSGLAKGQNGALEEWRFYKAALSPEEIETLAAAFPTGGAPSGVPEHWYTFDGKVRDVGFVPLRLGGGDPGTDSQYYVVSREDGRQAMTGSSMYGSLINYATDFSVFCSAKMPTAENGVLFHLGYNSSAYGNAYSLALVRSASDVKLVTFDRYEADLQELITANVGASSRKFHSYGLVFTNTDKVLRLYVDGVFKGSATIVQRPREQNYQFFGLCGSGYKDLQEGLDGAVEDWRFYQKALTAVELNALANEFPCLPTGLMLLIR